jgi:hypothetical protein
MGGSFVEIRDILRFADEEVVSCDLWRAFVERWKQGSV